MNIGSKALALPSSAQLEASNQELEREISLRKQAELALEEREAMLRRIGDNLPNGAIYKVIREVDGSDRFSYISVGIERLTEVSVLLYCKASEAQSRVRPSD